MDTQMENQIDNLLSKSEAHLLKAGQVKKYTGVVGGYQSRILELRP